jgi:hypothetical protein
MSLKVNVFRSLLGNPLNTHNFLVQIPRLQDVQMLVTSTSFPTESLRQYVLQFQGEDVRFPSIPSNNGSWSCTLPEGEYAKVYKAIVREHALNYQQDTGSLTTWSVDDLFDIVVVPRGLRAGLTLNDKDVPFSAVLHDCYMSGVGEVQLSSAGATSAWNWTLNFAYTWIEYKAATPLSVTRTLSPVTAAKMPDIAQGDNEKLKSQG